MSSNVAVGQDSLSRYAIRKWKSVLENWCNVLSPSLSLTLLSFRGDGGPRAKDWRAENRHVSRGGLVGLEFN